MLQVWQPDHVIVEIEGPVRVASGPDLLGAVPPVVADWELLQVSLRVPYGELKAVDVAADAVTVRPEDAAGEAAGFALDADHIEIHQREGASAPDGSAMDVAMSAQNFQIAYPGGPAVAPLDLAMTATATALTRDLLAHPQDFLPRWQEAGGTLTISDLSVRQDESRLSARGELTPEPEGRVRGEVTVALAGPDVARPGATQAFGGAAPMLATALAFIGERTEIEGRPAVQGKLSLRDGKAFVGMIPLGRLPRLY